MELCYGLNRQRRHCSRNAIFCFPQSGIAHSHQEPEQLSAVHIAVHTAREKRLVEAGIAVILRDLGRFGAPLRLVWCTKGLDGEA